jgi:hypothetical protein
VVALSYVTQAQIQAGALLDGRLPSSRPSLLGVATIFISVSLYTRNFIGEENMPTFPSIDRSALRAHVAAGALLALVCEGAPPVRAQTMPSDPSPTCTVTSATFATWFQSGSPSLNGVVNPANSVAFPDSPNCSFYQWAKQMFLWVTSPAPSIYGGGGIILDSPTFYDVSPPDAGGNRTLLPHSIGIIRSFGVRAAQVGALGLPIIVDKTGRMLQVQRVQSVVSSQLRITDNLGNTTEIAHAERLKDGTLVLRNPKGTVIEPKRPPVETREFLGRQIAAPSATPLLVQSFIIDGIPIFFDSFGNLIEVEQGQADGAVLMSQNSSLIYYGIMVNDVYAYFLTGQKDGQILPGVARPQFPTSMADLNAITTFASAHGASFLDSQALAVEVKTSWVDAASLSNANDYITIEGTVPTYNTSSSTTWTSTGTKTIKLALVGVHVVGSTAGFPGHPEMIWSTFEHFGNTPNAAYQYVNKNGVLTGVPQSTVGTWLFSASNSSGPFNAMHMTQSGSSIQALPKPPATTPPPFTVSASDTIRWKAFGAASDISPNPIDGNTANSNTEIISINNNISGMMAAGDVRNNYFMTGATWTIGGAPPTGGQPSPGNPGNQVGTSQLANSTMETYEDGNDTTSSNAGTNFNSNCFSCHASGGSPINITVLSHIYGAIKPLF